MFLFLEKGKKKAKTTKIIMGFFATITQNNGKLHFCQYKILNTLATVNIDWLKKLPGCLFIRTFFTEELYTLLRMLKCLKLYAMHPPLPSLICEIKTRLILWNIFIIKVINYALWHTFESKRYMYFHNRTWYTCTRYYM